MDLYRAYDPYHQGYARLAAEHRGRVYSYVPNLGRFVFNDGLSRDWIFDRDFSYHPVTAAQARRIVAAGDLGRLHPVDDRELLAYFTPQARTLTVDEVLATPSPKAAHSDEGEA